MQPTVARARFVFLDYLRAIAAWAVVYDHMIEQWIEPHGPHFRIADWIRTYIFAPLGVIQDSGWLAVCLFFLVSGFVITHVTARETVIEFGIKRVFRIFPMLILAVLVIIASDPGLRAHLSMSDILRNMALLNYVHTPEVVIVSVAWTLVIETIFYVLTMLTMPLKRPWISLAVNLAVVLLTIEYARDFGDQFFLFAASMAYVPYLVVGQIAYLKFQTAYLSAPASMLMLAVCFVALLFGIMSIHTQFLSLNNSYLINFFYAVAIFCVFMLGNDRLAHSAVVCFFADTSYAVYLVHGIVGPAIFAWTSNIAGPRTAVASTVLAIVAVSYLVHRLFERPMIDIGRRLSAHFTPAEKVAAAKIVA